MINAKPNLNGDTQAEFTKAARTLYMAVGELRSALSAAQALTHGRNYQTLVDPSRMRRDDLAKFAEARDAVEMLQQLSIDLFDAGRD